MAKRIPSSLAAARLLGGLAGGYHAKRLAWMSVWLWLRFWSLAHEVRLTSNEAAVLCPTCHHEICRIRPEQAGDLVGFAHIWVQPVVLVLGQQNDRHTVVDRRHELVRLCRDYGTRVQLAVNIGGTPVIVEGNEEQKSAVVSRDAVIRLLADDATPLQ